MKKKVYAGLLLLVAFAFSFASCEGDNDPIPVSNSTTRTVLVYVVADNSLADYPYFDTMDVNEMVEGMKQVDSSLYNLLVYVDTHSAAPVLYRLVRDQSGKVNKEVVKQYEEQVSTDVEVMKEVVNNAFNAYPADSYGLDYWSHGEGWLTYTPITGRWVGWDDDGGDGPESIDSRMNITDLATVLQSCPHLDFLLFDACFMQSVEVAYELRTYADYIIGSPTEIPGPGAPYDEVVPKMFASDDRETTATEIAGAYFDYYNAIYDGSRNPTNANWTGGVSIGVIKTSALEELAAATREVLPSSIDVSDLINSASVFNYDRRVSNVGYYDMDGFIQAVATPGGYAAWRTAFEKACIYWQTTGKNCSASTGLFSMQAVLSSGGISHYLSLFPSSRNGRAYRSTKWYQDVELSRYGW